MDALVWLDEQHLEFPDTSQALCDPDGLLAVGGDLSPERLLQAYSRGIFPWFSDDQPILWWSPDPRTVLVPAELHVGRSVRKLLNKKPFKITMDHAFHQVIRQCASISRNGENGTWITDDMLEAYLDLHHAGFAHSVEAWQGDQLVGGLYGIALGKAFFGESMFSSASGASKIAFVHLVKQLQRWQFELIDCQMKTEYLMSFGAKEVSREQFESKLKLAIPEILAPKEWRNCNTMAEF
ncbi:MAG: leucyl/phenylalanyl-tRNA--protein transferase [Alteromonadaceae bacterium]|nr:MAG: leucyl/phenylalanyl-tRNA--protein transferase [Alteromonadaceae bacterium]